MARAHLYSACVRRLVHGVRVLLRTRAKRKSVTPALSRIGGGVSYRTAVAGSGLLGAGLG